MKRLLCFIAALLALPAANAWAGVTAGTQITSSGIVVGTLSWQAGESPANMRLTITRNGAVAFDQAIPDVCGDLCLHDLNDAEDFQTTDLDGDGEPEVLVRAGGAGDDKLGIYYWDGAAGGYRELFDHFPELSLPTHHGKLLIAGQDTRFSSLEPAESTFPARVFEYAAGPKLVDVTRTEGLAQVRDDLEFRASDVKDFGTAPVGANRATTIAYVADEYLLGRSAFARRQLDRLITQGSLGTRKSAATFRRRLLSAL